MNLLVTGARGFVGSGLLPLLSARGWGGTATGRSPLQALPPGWQGGDRAAMLTEPASTSTVPDAIVHLEVRQHVPRPTAADRAEFTAVNVGGTRDWLAWAERHAVRRFVHLSSIKAVVAGPGPTAEDAPPEGTSPYGRSKAEAEAAVRAWAAADPARTAVILRPAPVYGPGNQANLAAFVRRVLAGRPALVGRGDARKSIVSRTNLGTTIAFCLEHVGPGCHVFNVSDAETTSLAELAATIAEIGGAPPPRRLTGWLADLVAPCGDLIERVSGREFPLTRSRLQALRETTVFPCTRLVAAGFRHPQTTRAGLAEMIAWARAAGG